MDLTPQVQGALITGCASLFAAALAILGVGLTLRSNRRKHSEDAERDLRKHQENAALAVRKDSFLSFLDASSEVIWWLSLCVSREVSIQDGLAAMKRFATAGARVHASAGEETLEAVITMQEAIVCGWMECYRWKLLLLSLQEDVESAQTNADAAGVAMTETFEPKSGDPERRAAFEEHLAEHARFTSEAFDASGAIGGATATAQQRCQHVVRSLLEPQDNLLLIARRELHVPIDHEWYLRRKRRFYEAMEKAAKEHQPKGHAAKGV